MMSKFLAKPTLSIFCSPSIVSVKHCVIMSWLTCCWTWIQSIYCPMSDNLDIGSNRIGIKGNKSLGYDSFGGIVWITLVLWSSFTASCWATESIRSWAVIFMSSKSIVVLDLFWPKINSSDSTVRLSVWLARWLCTIMATLQRKRRCNTKTVVVSSLASTSCSSRTESEKDLVLQLKAKERRSLDRNLLLSLVTLTRVFWWFPQTEKEAMKSSLQTRMFST